MKKRFAFILTVLLLCTTLSPTLLATDEPLATSNNGAIPSDGLGNSLSMSLQVTPSVFTVTPSVITLTSFDEPYLADAVAFPAGTSQEVLSAWFADVYSGFTGYDAQGNSYDLMSSSWSLDKVDTSTPGVYYASATPDLGEDYILANGLSLPQQLCAVSIQIPGEPDINSCVSGHGALHFPWILSDEQQDKLNVFAVWLRQDNGEWTQLSKGFYFAPDYLHLSQNIFKTGSTYSLKVTYPGGQTGVLTFTYDGELSIINYSGGDRDGGDVNGGGSSSGSQPPPPSPQAPDDSYNPNDSYDGTSHTSNNSTPVQNASSLSSNKTSSESDTVPEGLLVSPKYVFNESVENPLSHEVQPKRTFAADKLIPVFSDPSAYHNSENTSAALGAENQADRAKAILHPLSDSTTKQPETLFESPKPSAAVLESYSPSQTVISGLRLRDLCTDEESVVFGSGNLTVSIPSKLLLGLNLSDSDTLLVKLTQLKNNQIMFAAAASGKSITTLSGTVLRLRYTPQSENAEITIQNEENEEIPSAAFDGEFLRFAADKAGTYTILEAPKAQEAQKNVLPVLSLAGGLFVAAGGMTLFWRKRHG